jgi:hypothetical protein
MFIYINVTYFLQVLFRKSYFNFKFIFLNPVVHFATYVFGDEPRKMLKAIQRFDKHCSCLLQGECLLVARLWKPYTEQVVGGEWDVT